MIKKAEKAKEIAMSRNIAVFFAGTVIVATGLFAQPSTWVKTYGGTYTDWANSVQQTSDEGYVIAGSTYSFGTRDGNNDVWLIKTDTTGDTLWTRTYTRSSDTSSNEAAFSVRQTSDGGYIIAGYTGSLATGLLDVYLLKTNADGDTVWTKTFGEADYLDIGFSVQQTSDGGYITTGITESYGAGEADVWLIKTDANGDTTWTRTYGGTENDEGNCLQQTSDGGYIITGVTTSYGEGTPDSSNVYLIKTDANGDTIWTKAYGGAGDEAGQSVQQTSDAGYIITGVTTSCGAGEGDVWLIKTDANGDTTWTKTFGGASLEWGSSVQQTSDEGYIITGVTESYGAGEADVWLIKTDSNGEVVWTRTFGGTGDDEGYSVEQASDGGYIIAGVTELSVETGNVYLIKTDSLGNVGIEEEKEYDESSPIFITASPNPAGPEATIRYALPEETRVSLKVYDASGRMLKVLADEEQSSGVHSIYWNGRDDTGKQLSSGVYFLNLKAGEFSVIDRIVILR
jgi:hypothetical protein